MEIRRRAADTLLRCQASPLTNHPASFSMRCRIRPTRSIQRTLTSSCRRCARLPPPTTSATPPTEQKTNVAREFASLFNKRPPRHSSTPQGSFEKRVNGGSSDQDLLLGWEAKKGSHSASMNVWDKMLLPNSQGGTPGSIYETIPRESMKIPKTPLMRLTPSTGRTVSVGGNVDVTRAFSLLAQSCARNAVRRDHTRQKFHERPGLKRKKLASLRWRKRFRQGFKAAVARVQHLRKQGW